MAKLLIYVELPTVDDPATIDPFNAAELILGRKHAETLLDAQWVNSTRLSLHYLVKDWNDGG